MDGHPGGGHLTLLSVHALPTIQGLDLYPQKDTNE